MNRLEIEVLSDAVNCPIIQLPGRKSPGLLIQGDTLKNIADAVEELGVLDANSDEFRDELAALTEQLTSMVNLYERALSTHKINLPYTSKVSYELA